MSMYFRDEDRKATGKALVEAISRALDGHDYDTGAVEAANNSADNIMVFVGRLALVLIEKGLLTDEDIKKCIDPGVLGYEGGEHKWPK